MNAKSLKQVSHWERKEREGDFYFHICTINHANKTYTLYTCVSRSSIVFPFMDILTYIWYYSVLDSFVTRESWNGIPDILCTTSFSVDFRLCGLPCEIIKPCTATQTKLLIIVIFLFTFWFFLISFLLKICSCLFIGDLKTISFISRNCSWSGNQVCV